MEMKLLLVVSILITLNQSAYPQHVRVDSVCGIKKISTRHKLFKDRTVLRFNQDCMLASKNNNGYKLSYHYRRSKDIDTVFVSKGWIFTYEYDSTGRLIKDTSKIGKFVTEKIYRYATGSKQLLGVNIRSDNGTEVLRSSLTFIYTNSKAKHPLIEISKDSEGFITETEYVYDSRGNPSSIRNYIIDKDGNRLEDNRYVGGFPCSPCEYKYNSRGHWVRQYQLSYGKKLLYAVRKIRYR